MADKHRSSFVSLLSDRSSMMDRERSSSSARALSNRQEPIDLESVRRRRRHSVASSEEMTLHSPPRNLVSSTKSQRQAQMELYDYNQRRVSRRSIVDLRGQTNRAIVHHLEDEDDDLYSEETRLTYGSFDADEEKRPFVQSPRQHGHHKTVSCGEAFVRSAVGQIPAITVVSLLILMTALPFGVAYFPVGWMGSDEPTDSPTTSGGSSEGDDIQGSFPLPGKEALGIRMCIFATLMGQLVMTFTSEFTNPIAFQLLENVPFYHALARTVVQEQGYGIDALATLFFLFGLSSVLVGLVFYFLGKFRLGKVLYFFPGHVLVGCIGGIGIFIAITAVSVTNNVEFTMDLDGIRGFIENIHLFGVVIVLETILRVLMFIFRDNDGKPSFPLLAPVFFCMIVPLFYCILAVAGIDVATAEEAGYFFPSIGSHCDVGVENCAIPSFFESVFDGHVLDMFKIVDFRLISWTAVFKSLGTVISMASFSMIHVPINIPAFAVSSGVEADMNAELIAHGYANCFSGLFGGLQTIMTYSFSVLYMKSGGDGRASSLAVTAVGVLLFVFGPMIATFIPRAMAGTLLLHIGIDLFLEGIVDSYGSYDYLEYAGILLIAFVMTTFGMTAALVAGIMAALSTYAVQSVTNLDPIFRIMTASTLRSSSWTRSRTELEVLEDKVTGRSRILIVQLQGHLFFGNIAALTDSIKRVINEKTGAHDEPVIVILDFTLVVGMDSSAAHAVAKLKGILHRVFKVEVTIFVSGCHRDSFPCDYALAEALSAEEDKKDAVDFSKLETKKSSRTPRGSIYMSPQSRSLMASQSLPAFPKNRVCSSLDEALSFAEDILIVREKPSALRSLSSSRDLPEENEQDLTPDQEALRARGYLETLAATINPDDPLEAKRAVAVIVSQCIREEFRRNEIVWRQGSDSDSMKLLIVGEMIAYVEETDISEKIRRGSTIGELGLVNGTRRLSTVECVSDVAITYTLTREAWVNLERKNPKAARMIDLIVIRYLSQRVQHVSNRIYETRCLPI